MNKQVQEIYDEIEAQKKYAEGSYVPGENNDYWFGKVLLCQDLLAFIKYLPDDPITAATLEFIDAVSRYVEPKKGDTYCNRGEVLRKRDKLKALLK